MSTYSPDRTESAAAIARHPLHPFLVAFPITFLIGAFFTDLMVWGSGDPFWARASSWLIGAGLVTGIVAAIAGFMDFVAVRRARSLTAGWIHFIGNDIALLLAAWNLWRRLQHPGADVVPGGLILSGAVVLILGVTGWLGGELAFRHHIGMIRPSMPRNL